MRRRPVPREWREDHHVLTVRSRIAGGGWGGWSRVYRAGGHCSCGRAFGSTAGKHNLDSHDVREEWKDHVEDAYYEREDS